MTTFAVDGLEIAYDRAGDGPPLVLAHGAAADGRSWRPQLDALADDLTVVAWDEPGAGRSSDAPRGFGLADYADCLAALIEAVGRGPAHVGGLSWGGTVVLECWRRHPEVIGTLVLAGTYAGWKGSLPPDEVAARVEGFRRMLSQPSGTVELEFPGLFAGDPPAEFVPLLADMAADVRPATMRLQLPAIAEADLNDVLPTIRVPTLLVWGELDTRSPLDVAHRFHSAIPGSELVVIPGAGHVANLEDPARFNDAVRAFCRAHVLGGRPSPP